MYGYKKKNTEENNGGLPFAYDKKDAKNLPPEIDWRIFGVVTPVKGIIIFIFFFSTINCTSPILHCLIILCVFSDQSICGSCWSFGTTGTIEGAYALKHGVRKSFSEQVLMLSKIQYHKHVYVQYILIIVKNSIK